MLPFIIIPARSDGQPWIKLPPGCMLLLHLVVVLVGLMDIAFAFWNRRSIVVFAVGVFITLLGVGVTINYLRRR